MKYCLSLSLLLLLTLFAPAIAVAETATADFVATTKQVIGAWKLDFTTPDDVHRTPIVIVGRQHDQLVAWYVENEQPESFKKVALEGEQLVLTIRPKTRPEVEVTLKAQQGSSEDKCTGTATYRADDGGTGSWPFTGARLTPDQFDGTEAWNINFVAPDGERHDATVTVLEKDGRLYAWYSGRDHELPASKMEKNGDAVVLTVEAKTADGTDVKVTFNGKVANDRVSGTANFDLGGETGSFSFEGRRKS
ncbi:MAG: hypothetical protein R3E01_00145 [Pirellulaceae bacterium]|nr:hypothetical protein [Planctomycetales bacterium]